MLVGANFGAGILCSCSCPRRSGHNVPVKLQQGKCCSLFCSFLFLNEWKHVITLKVRELTMGSLSISNYSRHSYLVAKAIEYKIKVKTSSMSQMCSSLLPELINDTRSMDRGGIALEDRGHTWELGPWARLLGVGDDRAGLGTVRTRLFQPGQGVGEKVCLLCLLG